MNKVSTTGNTKVNGIKITGVITTLAALCIFALPAQARYDYENWQPEYGPVHSWEDNLETQLNVAYKNGLIDTNELSQMRRDLDGIEAQEDEFRVDHNGLGANDIKCMMSKLNRFQGDLNRAIADKLVVEVAVVDRTHR